MGYNMGHIIWPILYGIFVRQRDGTKGDLFGIFSGFFRPKEILCPLGCDGTGTQIQKKFRMG